VRDFAELAETARRQGWSLVALDVDVDTTTPTGELVANVSASVSQWERRIIGARTADALQARKAQGVRLGRPVTLPDEIRDRIATERAEGASLSAIARTLTAEGVPTARGGAKWYPSTVRAVVQSLDLDAEATAARDAA
jgi:DNA invertase Pin-like site-specific DNA recombinase